MTLTTWNIPWGRGTDGLREKEPWPGAPFMFDFDFVCVSAELAGRVRDVRVDETSDASAHPPMLLEQA